MRVTTVLASKTASHNTWVRAASFRILGLWFGSCGKSCYTEKSGPRSVVAFFSLDEANNWSGIRNTRGRFCVPRDQKVNVLKSKRTELPPPATHPTLLHRVILAGCYTGIGSQERVYTYFRYLLENFHAVTLKGR